MVLEALYTSTTEIISKQINTIQMTVSPCIHAIKLKFFFNLILNLFPCQRTSVATGEG